MDGCACKECLDKKSGVMMGIDLAQKKIEEEFKKSLMSLGLPRANIMAALDRARREVK